jgi:hypothetical protein
VSSEQPTRPHHSGIETNSHSFDLTCSTGVNAPSCWLSIGPPRDELSLSRSIVRIDVTSDVTLVEIPAVPPSVRNVTLESGYVSPDRIGRHPRVPNVTPRVTLIEIPGVSFRVGRGPDAALLTLTAPSRDGFGQPRGPKLSRAAVDSGWISVTPDQVFFGLVTVSRVRASPQASADSQYRRQATPTTGTRLQGGCPCRRGSLRPPLGTEVLPLAVCQRPAEHPSNPSASPAISRFSRHSGAHGGIEPAVTAA